MALLPMEKKTSNGIQIHINGKVQGVGFRPYVWQQAKKYKLWGNVSNDGQGVVIHLWKGDTTEPAGHTLENHIDAFLKELPQNIPPLAHILTLKTKSYHWEEPPVDFQIVHSTHTAVETQIVPDAATCPACLAEQNDPTNRRYQYPFINCTHCGPRFSIIEHIPYDRPYTSMKEFTMCAACQAEYDNPADRRFHAQPNACAACGPQTTLYDPRGVLLAEQYDAIQQAASALINGQIVAIKGLGGFHLACDALNATAVKRLRSKKDRPSKPLAVMLPDESWLKSCVQTRTDHELAELVQLLKSVEAPIVLVEKNTQQNTQQNTQKTTQKNVLPPLCEDISPRLNEVGVMLPANPLQHLLMQLVKRPLVMTSGNPRGAPPAMANTEALSSLQSIADLWLMHNRHIVQRVDDSVVRLNPTGFEALRRARGYAPSDLQLPKDFKNNPVVLAMGGDLKNVFCLLRKNSAVLSQHLGDLEDLNIQAQFKKTISLFQSTYELAPQLIAVDAHPNYISHAIGRAMAKELNIPCVEVAHHHAHIASCMAEHGHSLHDGNVIGITLDGLGYGVNPLPESTDESAKDKNTAHPLWGGECLLANYHTFAHLGGLPPVAMPGGNLASQQPWRNLLAHLIRFVPQWKNLPEVAHIPTPHLSALEQAISQGLNAPLASSAGRLFDAAAAALGIAPAEISWEGEAACQLEALAKQSPLYRDLNHAPNTAHISMPVIETTVQGIKKRELNLAHFWQHWLACSAPIEDKAFIFHKALAGGFAALAMHTAKENHVSTIVFSGGVLHNTLMRQLFTQALKGYRLYFPQQLPAGDGGLAYGQALIAAANYAHKKQTFLKLWSKKGFMRRSCSNA